MYNDVLIDYIVHINGIATSLISASRKVVVDVQLKQYPNGNGEKHSKKLEKVYINNVAGLHIMSWDIMKVICVF
jgi:hypothetical protein